MKIKRFGEFSKINENVDVENLTYCVYNFEFNGDYFGVRFEKSDKSVLLYTQNIEDFNDNHNMIDNFNTLLENKHNLSKVLTGIKIMGNSEDITQYDFDMNIELIKFQMTPNDVNATYNRFFLNYLKETFDVVDEEQIKSSPNNIYQVSIRQPDRKSVV